MAAVQHELLCHANIASVVASVVAATYASVMLQRNTGSTLLIGWREWVSLPLLHLPFVKAKVDTGARTSSLHAFDIYTTTERGQPRVHFSVHPMQRRDLIVQCAADIIDYRTVSDSGGHRERRYVIETPIQVGDLRWKIELTLANRESMTFRMLLGREAMKQLIVEPGRSYLLGRPASVLKTYRQNQKSPKPAAKRTNRSK